MFGATKRKPKLEKRNKSVACRRLMPSEGSRYSAVNDRPHHHLLLGRRRRSQPTAKITQNIQEDRGSVGVWRAKTTRTVISDSLAKMRSWRLRGGRSRRVRRARVMPRLRIAPVTLTCSRLRRNMGVRKKILRLRKNRRRSSGGSRISILCAFQMRRVFVKPLERNRGIRLPGIALWRQSPCPVKMSGAMKIL